MRSRGEVVDIAANCHYLTVLSSFEYSSNNIHVLRRTPQPGAASIYSTDVLRMYIGTNV